MPGEGATFELNVSGTSEHQNIKPKQLRGIERKKECYSRFQSAAERRVQLLNDAGIYTSELPTAAVLRKARSEIRVQNRGSTDITAELLALRVSLKPSFIREFHIIPFRVIMWLEQMIRCYSTACKNRRITLYMDAIASFLRNVLDRQVFVVSVVMEGTEGNPPLAVALMLTASHDTPSYTTFLQKWWHTINSKQTLPLPKAFVIDLYWPSIHAAMMVFNKCGIVQYLHLCWNTLNEHGSLDHICLLGIGRSHTIKDIVRWEEMECKHLQTKMWWRYSIVRLITMTKWREMVMYLQLLLRVLLSPTISQCSEAMEAVDEMIVGIDMHAYDGPFTNTFNQSNSQTAIYQQSPFYQFGKKIFNQIEEALPAEQPLAMANARMNIPLANKVLKIIVAFAPLVTGIMTDLEDHKDQRGWLDAVVESWQAILKHNMFRNLTNIWPQEFIKISHSSLSGRCLDYLGCSVPSDDVEHNEQLSMSPLHPQATAYDQICSISNNSEAATDNQNISMTSLQFHSHRQDRNFSTSDILDEVMIDEQHSTTLPNQIHTTSEAENVIITPPQSISMVSPHLLNQHDRNNYLMTERVSEQQQDCFKKRSRKRSKYVNPSTVPTVAQVPFLSGLPTGGISKLNICGRKITLASGNTCALDNLLIIGLLLLKNAAVRDRISAISWNDYNDNSRQFVNCLLQMHHQETASMKDARSKLLFQASIFKQRTMSIPFRSTNTLRNHFECYLDCNEQYLADVLLLPIRGTLSRHSSCNRLPDTENNIACLTRNIIIKIPSY